MLLGACCWGRVVCVWSGRRAAKTKTWRMMTKHNCNNPRAGAKTPVRCRLNILTLFLMPLFFAVSLSLLSPLRSPPKIKSPDEPIKSFPSHKNTHRTGTPEPLARHPLHVLGDLLQARRPPQGRRRGGRAARRSGRRRGEPPARGRGAAARARGRRGQRPRSRSDGPCRWLLQDRQRLQAGRPAGARRRSDDGESPLVLLALLALWLASLPVDVSCLCVVCGD